MIETTIAKAVYSSYYIFFMVLEASGTSSLHRHQFSMYSGDVIQKQLACHFRRKERLTTKMHLSAKSTLLSNGFFRRENLSKSTN